MKRLVPILILVLAIALGIRAFRPPVPLAHLSQLKAGMPQSEVKAILGEPSKIYPSGQWTYTRPMTFGFVNIHWKSDGTYDGHYNYERF